MISILTYVVNLLATVTQWLFITASLLGQVIVKVTTTVVITVLKSAESLLLFFRIVYEDNFYIFSEDIPSSVTELLNTVNYQWTQVQNHINVFYINGVNNIKLLFENVKWFSQEIMSIISESMLFWKRSLIFLGETLWLMLTFIPIHLPKLMSEIWQWLRDHVYHLIIEVYMGLLKLTNFMTDVPLESFIGLLVTMIIVRLCIHFKHTLRVQISALYWLVIRKILYIYHMVHNYFNDYETRLIAHMVRGQQITTRQDAVNTPIEDSSNGADALCVICQERPKCVLTLPCRHVCLCSECCMRLYGYQRTCPICRTFIYHSVTVYL